ncbi:MAG: hypothetical protein AAFW00_15065 [Bacteroidota bacterium]
MSEDFSQHTGVGLMQDLDRLGAYVEGKLSAEEMAETEAYIAQDPLLQDMVEGLRELENPEEIRGRIQQMRLRHQSRLLDQAKKRAQLSKRKFRVQPQRYLQLSLGLAAGLALTLLSIYLIYKLKPSGQVAEPMAMREQVQQGSPDLKSIQSPLPPSAELNKDAVKGNAAEQLDELTSTESTSPPQKDQAKQELRPTVSTSDESGGDAFADPSPVQSVPPLVPKRDQFKQEPRPTVSNSDEGAYEVSAPSPKPATVPSMNDFANKDGLPKSTTTPILEDESVTERKVMLDSADPRRYYEGAIDDGEIVIQDERPDKKDAAPLSQEQNFQYYKGAKPTDEPTFGLTSGYLYTALLEEGIKAYDQEDFETATNRFSEILLTEPTHVIARHYTGLIAFLKEDFKASIASFKYVLPASPVFDESQYYMAQAYIKLNKKWRAQKILEQIVKSQGTYHKEAEALLKNL